MLTLTWADWDAGFRKTRKTGVTLPIVAASYPDLETAVAAERARQAASDTPNIYVIVNEGTGRKYHPDVFSHQFRALADAAGIPKDLQFRDLRATAATEPKDAGADILDIVHPHRPQNHHHGPPLRPPYRKPIRTRRRKTPGQQTR